MLSSGVLIMIASLITRQDLQQSNQVERKLKHDQINLIQMTLQPVNILSGNHYIDDVFLLQ
ncbi:hypothetical protein OIO90_001569 [Microbotryomycetes sp. JL221]|nr:hypothetical protein OIO90_001569 [Microbotryomycetes sp. JL221]